MPTPRRLTSRVFGCQSRWPAAKFGACFPAKSGESSHPVTHGLARLIALMVLLCMGAREVAPAMDCGEACADVDCAQAAACSCSAAHFQAVQASCTCDWDGRQEEAPSCCLDSSGPPVKNFHSPWVFAPPVLVASWMAVLRAEEKIGTDRIGPYALARGAAHDPPRWRAKACRWLI